MAAWRILPARRRIRLPAAAYCDGDPYLITICTPDKRPLFDEPVLANIVVVALQEHVLPDRGPILAYCLMPEHLHALLVATGDLLAWVRGFKATTTGRARRARLAGELWQRSFHDRRIPPSDSALRHVVAYILENPVRRGLVDRWDAWPHSWAAWEQLGLSGPARGGPSGMP